jgi:putative transcriptional regulator
LSYNKEEELESGKLLVAEPFLTDPNFKRGVILLCDHQEDGSFGFILNKPIEMNISDLISSFPEFESEVHYGGPVQTDTIHYLHTKGSLLPDSIKVLSGVYWGGDFEQLKSFIKLGKIQPEDIRFFVGYSGWSTGQLKEERKVLSWMMVDGHADYIFGDNKELWKDVLEEEGGTYSVIAQIPTPILN